MNGSSSLITRRSLVVTFLVVCAVILTHHFYQRNRYLQHLATQASGRGNAVCNGSKKTEKVIVRKQKRKEKKKKALNLVFLGKQRDSYEEKKLLRSLSICKNERDEDR
jgi:hypothetical protein